MKLTANNETLSSIALDFKRVSWIIFAYIMAIPIINNNSRLAVTLLMALGLTFWAIAHFFMAIKNDDHQKKHQKPGRKARRP
ncbi:MAG: hypothetical protein ACYDHY_15920 [Acidiferrobacterales bacterium]